MDFLWFILIGIAAGFLAGRIMKGSGFGLIVNLLVGIAGAVLGGWLFGILGIGIGGLIGALVTALVGAIVLLWVISLFKKK
jgi:Transglycosylase associated protein.